MSLLENPLLIREKWLIHLGGNLVMVGNRSSATSSASASCLPLFLFGITSLLTGSAVVDLSTVLYLLRLLLDPPRLEDGVVLLGTS